LSVTEDLTGTFRDLAKDVSGVLSTVVVMGVLMILLPVLLQMQKLVTALQGQATGAGTATTSSSKVGVGNTTYLITTQQGAKAK
jgi:hypothetical protein